MHGIIKTICRLSSSEILIEIGRACVHRGKCTGLFGSRPQLAKSKVWQPHYLGSCLVLFLTLGSHKILPCRFPPIACRLVHVDCGKLVAGVAANFFAATCGEPHFADAWRGFVWPWSKQALRVLWVSALYCIVFLKKCLNDILYVSSKALTIASRNPKLFFLVDETQTWWPR